MLRSIGTPGVCTLLFVLSLLTSTSLAQSLSKKFKAGEEVEMKYLGDWIPALVLDTNRTHAKVEYKFAGRPYQRVFKKDVLRYPWEGKALTQLRTWKDASGSFSVSAVVTDFDEEAQTITLYRPDKEKEVVLKIDKLSTRDQALAKKLFKTASQRAKALPATVSFSLARSDTGDWGSASDLGGLQPDPSRIDLAVPAGGAGFYKTTSRESLVGLFPIGTKSGWMVAGTKSASDEFPSRLAWVTLADGKVRKQHAIANKEALIAIDAASQQVLTYGKDADSRRANLTIWKASPKLETAKPIVRWASQESDRHPRSTSWADFVSPTRVIHQWSKHGYVVWDFADKKAVFSVTQESFFGAKVALSPGRKYLAVPEDKRVRVLNSNNGKTLAVLPIEGGSCSGVGFSVDGSRLAVMTRNQIAVWTLGSASEPTRVRSDLVGSPFAKSIHWVDGNSLLVGGNVLFDLNLELPVWKYAANTWEVKRDSWGSRTISVVGGRYCYSVTTKGGKSGGIVVGAVDLPGPMVKEVVSTIDPEQLYAVRRGDSVSLEIDCVQFDDRVRAALGEEIAENGWQLQSSAPFILKATMGRGEQQTVTYEIPRTGERQTASVVPFTGRLTLRRAGAAEGRESWPLWQSGSSTGLSSMILLREGETAQQRADEQQRPRPEFFEHVDVPEKIFDRRYSGGFGTSTIDSRGLTPKPLDNLPTK